MGWAQQLGQDLTAGGVQWDPEVVAPLRLVSSHQGRQVWREWRAARQIRGRTLDGAIAVDVCGPAGGEWSRVIMTALIGIDSAPSATERATLILTIALGRAFPAWAPDARGAWLAAGLRELAAAQLAQRRPQWLAWHAGDEGRRARMDPPALGSGAVLIIADQGWW